MTDNDKLYINGIDAETGQYLTAPMTFEEAARFVRGEPFDRGLVRFFKRMWRRLTRGHLGLPAGVHADNIPQAGWAVVFHQDEEPGVKEVLQPLIDHRREQVGDGSRVKVLAYDGQQDAHSWLASQGVAPGTVMPWRVPFYLLLVGSPERIPFPFGHLLDVEYAVGRLHFDDVDGYSQYVDSLLAYENGQAPPRAKRAVFFATRHRFDRATQLSADDLVGPLADGLPPQNGEPAQLPVAEAQGYQTEKLHAEEATKAALAGILTPPAGMLPPAFLFTASHGLGYRQPSPDQYEKHGALICQDWPGFGSFAEGYFFSAEDLAAESRVHGLIAFLFACYGAGTPAYDRFLHIPGEPPPQISDRPFLAALPKALLSHPGGGALACIGHVERAWSYSIRTAEAGPVIQPFRNTIQRILSGQPVGFAVKDFNERYSALSTSQSQLLERASLGLQASDRELAITWAMRNDAEGYLVVGDPAVRLRVDDLV